MKETIKLLRATLPAEEFVVTGSFVLAEYGLVKHEDVGDLDIILIHPLNSTLETLERLMRESPAPKTAAFLKFRENLTKLQAREKKYEEYVDDDEEIKRESSCTAVFSFNSKKVDVFIENRLDEPCLLVDGINYTTIPHIIRTKQSYNRMKDWLSLRAISRIFFKEEDFQLMLNHSWKSTLRENYE